MARACLGKAKGTAVITFIRYGQGCSSVDGKRRVRLDGLSTQGLHILSVDCNLHCMKKMMADDHASREPGSFHKGGHVRPRLPDRAV